MLRILPVIDLKGGQVVRGVAGRRQTYRPIHSHLVADARPETVARALTQSFSFHQAYVADLDALGGAEPDEASLERIAAAGLQLWLDAGVGDLRRASRLAQLTPAGRPLGGVIVALECLPGPAGLSDIFQALGPQRAVFSLDLKNGRPLSAAAAWHCLTPLQIAEVAVQAGFRQLVVLDLARVGTGQGPAVAPLCRQLRSLHPQLQLIAGGGVRGKQDLRELAQAGCHAALVASALHDGPLQPEDVRAAADG